MKTHEDCGKVYSERTRFAPNRSYDAQRLGYISSKQDGDGWNPAPHSDSSVIVADASLSAGGAFSFPNLAERQIEVTGCPPFRSRVVPRL